MQVIIKTKIYEKELEKIIENVVSICQLNYDDIAIMFKPEDRRKRCMTEYVTLNGYTELIIR